MKIAIIHADHYTKRQGGGELTTKYWHQKAVELGLDVTWLHNESKEFPDDFDFYLIGNFPEFKNKSYLLNVINNKPHGFLVHSSIPWTQYNYFYRNAKFAVTLAPDHAQKIGLPIKNILVTSAYVNHNLFYPAEKEKSQAQVYVGLVHPLKINQSMINYIKSNPQTNFHFYGETRDFSFKSPNLKFYSEVKNEELNELYNSYQTFFWYLDRYGCFGRTIVEALLCNMELNVNKENFGLFKFPWISQGRQAIVDNLEKDLEDFWPRILNEIA
jgi:hypothetical protein